MNKVTFGKNSFCGPAVISSLAGCSTDEAAKLIQQIRGNSRAVRGAYTTEVCEAFRRLGYRSSYLTHLSGCGSLFYLLSVLDDGSYVVMVPGHFIALEIKGKEKYLCDNHTRKPLNVCSSARMTQQIETVVRIEKE